MRKKLTAPPNLNLLFVQPLLEKSNMADENGTKNSILL